MSQPAVAERRTHARLVARLGRLGFVLPGSLVERQMRRGTRTCRCHDDPPAMHGPYQQWTRTGNGKTVTRLLSPEALVDCRAWLENERVLRSSVARLHELAIAVLERDRRTTDNST